MFVYVVMFFIDETKSNLMIKDSESGLILCEPPDAIQEKLLAARRMKLKSVLLLSLQSSPTIVYLTSTLIDVRVCCNIVLQIPSERHQCRRLSVLSENLSATSVGDTHATSQHEGKQLNSFLDASTPRLVP